MKKRLRKKLRLREFKTRQWWMNCKFHPGLTEGRADEVKEIFSAFANAQGLFVFRAGSAEGYAFILDGSQHYKTPTEEQRLILTSFLQSLPEVASIEDKGLGYL
ncbi:50S ribosome-binding protein YggL [Hymenobacter coccineus]|uniref:50S ribosome-binding protein YggL n=1 Tax=Hymenobacter coccineus TaxID=1908235 RepID=UPI0009F7355B|nr:50S ribosome-binding protein YggL [Hymenobacter coccineus]